MNLKSVKNGIAATAIGVSTLGAGCAKNAPVIEKAVTQSAQTVKMKAGDLAKDTIDFAKYEAVLDSARRSTEVLKVPQNTALPNKDIRIVDSQIKQLMDTLLDIVRNNPVK